MAILHIQKPQNYSQSSEINRMSHALLSLTKKDQFSSFQWIV